MKRDDRLSWFPSVAQAAASVFLQWDAYKILREENQNNINWLRK